jgi:hypothetical protein
VRGGGEDREGAVGLDVGDAAGLLVQADRRHLRGGRGEGSGAGLQNASPCLIQVQTPGTHHPTSLMQRRRRRCPTRRVFRVEEHSSAPPEIYFPTPHLESHLPLPRAGKANAPRRRASTNPQTTLP